MDSIVSPLDDSQNTFSENGKKEDKYYTDGSDDEEYFKDKAISDSMTLPNNMESFEKENDRDIFGTTSKINSEKFDEIKEGSNLGGLESFNSLMQESKEIEISLESKVAGEIEIRVEAPKKSTEGMGAHLVYPINTKTTMNHFKQSSFSTSRRFNDFLTLYENLVASHQALGVIIPLPPEKDMIGMTKMKISNEDEVNSLDFVEKRRAALERFLTRIANHPKLVTDKSFVSFLQDEGEFLKSNAGGLLGGGIAKWFGKVGESLTKITSALPEQDQWYEDRLELMESTEHHLKELLASTEALILQRKDLATSTNQLSKAVGNLGSTEEDLSLSKVLSSLSEAIDKTEKLRSSLGLQLVIDSIKDNITFIAALRLSMNERNRIHKVWNDSEITLAKKVEQKTKFENQKKTDKLENASMEIHEWEERVKNNKKAFEEISENIKIEAKRLDKLRLVEVKVTVLECMQSNALLHKQIASVWEALIPQINKDL